jgi:formate-dependent nitrite reductase membrane component NrfD
MKKSSCSTACAALNWLVCLVLFLTTLAALAGVYKAHYFGIGRDAAFGTTSGSLSIIAFVLAVTLWSKWMCRCLCSCE